MAALWKRTDIIIDDLNRMGKNSMGEYLGIQFIEIGEDYLKATMPVDHRTKQPYGLLHGGASAVLVETIGSVASVLCIGKEQRCVGIEINCNHIRGKKEGIVTATAKPFHTGSSIHVWDIQLHDEHQKLICVGRLTVSILK